MTRESSETPIQQSQAQKRESLCNFAGGVAQVLSNQVTAILGYATLARQSASDPAAAQANLDQVLKAGEILADFCRKMQMCSGHIHTRCRPVNLSDIVQEISDRLRAIPLPPISLSLELAPDLPLINADAALVHEVVMQLVRNAVEAVVGREGTVVLRTRAAGADPELAVLLEVSDTGPGVSDSLKKTLFDPFITTKEPGRRLGLSIVQEIGHSHGATVDVHSEQGEPTVFWVKFPSNRGPEIC